MDAELLHFNSIGDERGYLTSLEYRSQIPFPVERVYYIYGTKFGVRRGQHAHRDLKQICICVNGSCRFEVFDGREKQVVILDSPTKGLYIGNMIWREMYDFSDDCVLMVLANRVYDESDYIRDKETFLSLVRKG